MKFIKKIDNKKIEYFLFALIFIGIFVVNFMTPMLADDFAYSIGSDLKRIDSLSDIFNYQVNHYLTWGGRTVAHTIAQLFLIMPRWIFSICNSVMQIFEVLLIYLLARNGKKNNPIIIVAIWFLLWFCLRAFGVSNIWLIGSCNYLWTTVLILFLIYQYSKERKDTPAYIVFMLILGIIAGWTNENTAFGSIVIIWLFIFIGGFKELKKYKWKIAGFIGSLIGFSAMILAPGNYKRSETLAQDASFIKRIVSRFINYTELITTYLLPLIIILVILISIYIYKKKKIDKKVYAYIAGSFFSIYSMLLSPQFPDRAWTGTVIFLIIPIVMLLYDIDNVSKICKIVFIDILIIASFVFVKDYLELLVDVNQLRNTWEYREKKIKQAKAKKKTKIKFDRYTPYNKRNPAYGLSDLQPDPSHWANYFTAAYYDLDEISSKE